MWTVPTDDCVAFPTPFFYRFRTVLFSNEGTSLLPKWVALDRYNDDDWHEHGYTTSQLAPLYDQIRGSKEGFDLCLEPNVILPPTPVGAPLMRQFVDFLTRCMGG
jgi:hypothetical protein